MLKFAHPVLACLIGVAAGYTVGLPVWLGMRDGLIAFLGLISAALLQLIPITTNFLAADELTPDEAQRLSAALSRQQHFWVGMLAVNVLTVVVLVLATILNDALLVDLPRLGAADLSPAVSGLIGGLLTFVLMRLTSTLAGVLSLQRLRSTLVLAAAKRRAAEKAEEIQRQLTPRSTMIPGDYGQIIRPPH